MPLPNLETMVCFITEQNPVKDLLLFYYQLLFLEGSPPTPFFFFPNSVFRQKKSVHYLEFKKAHATGMSSCPQANSLANPKH